MPSIDKAYQWAVQVCQSHNARYVWGANGQVVNGHPEYDCSSFVSAALRAGGFNCGRMTTHSDSMPILLPRMGFKRVTDGSVKPGDIGLNVGTHTEMAYSSGSNRTAIWMGAHNSGNPREYGVSIGTLSHGQYNRQGRRSFTEIWRYGSGASGEDPGEGETASSSKGYSAYVVSAICGCWWRESNCNPGVWENLTPVSWTTMRRGFGLGQWTNTSSRYGVSWRLRDVHNWLSANHYPNNSMDGQLEYLTVENYWQRLPAYSNYDSLAEFLNSDSTDISTLTATFLACWEGVPGNVLQERIEHAQTIYAYIIAHADDPLPTPIETNAYLSEAQILNNSLYIYKKLGRSGTGNSQPAGRGRTKKSMPIWMMLRNLF